MKRGNLTHRSVTLMFFASVAFVYVALSPLSIAGMGYASENTKAAETIIDKVSGKPVAMNWPRHGIIEPAIQAPVFLIGRLVFGREGAWKDRLSSLNSLVATALLCTLLFIWSAELAGSFVWGWIVAMVAAFGTMLWPYAYIGLETTQSLALLFAAYLALQRRSNRPFRQAVWLAVACGIALGVKSNGIFLGPAVAFLIWEYVRRTDARKRMAVAGLLIAVTGVIITVAAVSRTRSEVWSAGALTMFRAFSVDFVTFILNVLSILFSVNKGLLVFAPICVLAALSMRDASRQRPDIVAFALVTFSGLVVGVSMLFYWSDETWGPRYLHTAIGPLLLCFAAARRSTSFRVLRELPLLVAAGAGVAVSFLGVLFYYGNVHGIAQQTSNQVLEELQYDLAWNQPRVHLALARILIEGAPRPEPWPPPRHWWYAPPPDARAPKQVDLRPYAGPQPLLFQPAGTLMRRAVRGGLLVSLCLGGVLAIWSGIVARWQGPSTELSHLRDKEGAVHPLPQEIASMPGCSAADPINGQEPTPLSPEQQRRRSPV